VSIQIQALERIVGARLVERVRGRRGVRSTGAGAALFAHAVVIAAELDSAEQS
jgi:DNA-binding transcriptional LysR family regulator